jgi:NTE family protein
LYDDRSNALASDGYSSSAAIRSSTTIDGGYRSNENADLAAGSGRVLVLSPLGGRSRAPQDWGIHLAAQADELRARGSRVETIFRIATPATHSAPL